MPQRLRLMPFVIFGFLATAANAEENASNPLSAVNNTDLRLQSFDLDGGSRQDLFIDGAYMINPDLKFKYELHFNKTDVTGSTQTGIEKVNAKLLYFPSQTSLNDTWGLKSTVGIELILDGGNADKGIGTGSDQIAPLAGLAFSNKKTALTLIPLIQHFQSYNGSADIRQTSVRLIALQPFADDYWAKLDLKVPYDWTNETWPASAEIQIGYNLNSGLAIYADLMSGIGNDKSYNYGAGLGIRFSY